MTPERIQRFASSPVARQMLRFLVVGAIATAAHYSVLISLVELGHVAPVLATTAGYGVGVVVSYTLNRRFTFEASHMPVGSTFAKFVVSALIGMGLNAAIVAALTGLHVPYLLAQVISTGLVLFWNFAAARFFAFR